MKKLLFASLMVGLLASLLPVFAAGGTGGTALLSVLDVCPDGDDSGSMYDGTCGTFGAVSIPMTLAILVDTTDDGVSSVDEGVVTMDSQSASDVDTLGIGLSDTEIVTRLQTLTLKDLTGEAVDVDVMHVIRARNLDNTLIERVYPATGADPEMLMTVDAATLPAILPATGAQERNMLYLLLALCGCVGLLFLTRKQA